MAALHHGRAGAGPAGRALHPSPGARPRSRRSYAPVPRARAAARATKAIATTRKRICAPSLELDPGPAGRAAPPRRAAGGDAGRSRGGDRALLARYLEDEHDRERRARGRCLRLAELQEAGRPRSKRRCERARAGDRAGADGPSSRAATTSGWRSCSCASATGSGRSRRCARLSRADSRPAGERAAVEIRVATIYREGFSDPRAAVEALLAGAARRSAVDGGAVGKPDAAGRRRPRPAASSSRRSWSAPSTRRAARSLAAPLSRRALCRRWRGCGAGAATTTRA